MVLGFKPPRNAHNLFNGWYSWKDKNFRSLLLIGAAAILWSIWITRNKVAFDNCRPNSLLQVLFRGTHWLWFWTQLQWCEVQQALMVEARRSLETAAKVSLHPMDGLLCLELGFELFSYKNLVYPELLSNKL